MVEQTPRPYCDMHPHGDYLGFHTYHCACQQNNKCLQADQQPIVLQPTSFLIKCDTIWALGCHHFFFFHKLGKGSNNLPRKERMQTEIGTEILALLPSLWRTNDLLQQLSHAEMTHTSNQYYTEVIKSFGQRALICKSGYHTGTEYYERGKGDRMEELNVMSAMDLMSELKNCL